MQPRIYTYKITFEEVPYYYYGSKKEKYYNQEYWGSPKTNKWCWEFYTPKKQILEFFEYSDEGYLKCRELEERLIKPFLNDPFCLNQRCGGKFSLEVCRKSGQKHGNRAFELKIGVHALTKEQLSENGRKGGKIGGKIGGKMVGQKVGQKCKDEKLGICGLTTEQRIENGKKYGSKAGKAGSQKTNTQRWQCTETGYITNSGALSMYQKARGIDTCKRKRIE